jgi:hypothetical protein
MRTQTIRPRQQATSRSPLAGDGTDASILHLLHRACQRAEDLFQAETTGLDITPRQFAVLEKSTRSKASAKPTWSSTPALIEASRSPAPDQG